MLTYDYENCKSEFLSLKNTLKQTNTTIKRIIKSEKDYFNSTIGKYNDDEFYTGTCR